MANLLGSLHLKNVWRQNIVHKIIKTSDGIKLSDWNIIIDCVAQIANASANGAEDLILINNLFRELKTLEIKYGRLPSLLATEADYVDDATVMVSLLKEAYSSACEIHDIKNKTYISSSLVEAYLEEIEDSMRTKYWFSVFTEDLKLYSDSYLIELHQELKLSLHA